MHANYINRQRTAASITRCIVCLSFLGCVVADPVAEPVVAVPAAEPVVAVPAAEPVVAEAKPPAFRNVQIRDPFKAYLLNDPLLMEFAGAKIIKLRSGKTLIVGVASTPVGDKSPAQRIAAERVLRLKADREIIMLTGKVQVAVEEIIDDKTVITIKDGKEVGQSVERYRLIIKSTIKQSGKSLPFVGRWTSPDGQLLFYAVGTIIDPSK